MADLPQMSETPQTRIGAIFRQERKKLVRLVRWKLSEISSSDAEDMVQDVIHSILSRGDMVRQIEDLAGYLYRSLSNRIIDHQRRPVREVPLELPDSVQDHALRLVFEPVSTELDPEQQMIREQMRQQLTEALNQLPPRDRQLWMETEIHGRSFKELASKWHEPVGTLLSRKSRAGKRLRELLRAQRSD